MPKNQRLQLDLAYLIAEPNQTKAQPVKNTPLHVPMIDTANSVTPKPSYRGGNDKLLAKILLGFVCLAILGNEIKATNIPAGNATISGNATAVYITGGQYNNGSLTINSSGSLGNAGPSGAFTAAFNVGDGFHNYTLNNHGQISSNGSVSFSTNTIGIEGGQGNSGQFNFNNYGQVNSQTSASGAAVYMNGVTIPTFLNDAGATIESTNQAAVIFGLQTNLNTVSGLTIINEFINKGRISVGNDAPAALMIQGFVGINTLTNFGFIYASPAIGSQTNSSPEIFLGNYDAANTGSIPYITTLNNAQGFHSGGSLTYYVSGGLPSYYNVIIQGSTYGQLSAQYPVDPNPPNPHPPLSSSEQGFSGSTETVAESPGSAPTANSSFTFGIYAGSNLMGGTYKTVLQYFSSNQIKNPAEVGEHTTGPGGYTYQWTLVGTINGAGPNATSNYDLHVLSSINPNYANPGQPYYLASTVGPISNANATTMSLFEGGTLRLNHNNANYSFDFSLNGANTNTIDAAGLTSTFSGSFSNTSNHTGTINIQDSVGGGSVIFSGGNTFTGPLNIGSGSFTLASSGSLIAAANISSGSNLNNLGLMNGAVNNASGGGVQNAGTIAGAISNSGALNNINGGIISGAFTNNANGTVTNNLGLMNGAVNNASGGTIQNAGTIAGAISNSGTLNNNYGGIVSGVLTNNANGTVTNESQITNSVFNNGVFTNGILGNITGNITNAQGGQFYNDSTISVGITNNGNFTNYENIQSTFINGGMGTVVNMGSMHDITNEVSGVIINSSQINNVTNNGILYLNGNKPLITGGITGTGTVQINGNFTQEAPISNGAINVAGAFSQYPFFTGGVAETTANSLSVGVAGYAAGSLNLLGNLTVGTAEIGGASGSTGVVNMKGGRFATGNLSVGDYGNGTLNLIAGTLSVGNGTGNLILAYQAGSVGTLNIGTASEPGFGALQAERIYGGAGTAFLNFNYLGNYSFTPSIQGSVSVNQLGTGTLTLSGNNTYTGTTTVTSGTLVSGNLSGSTLILQNGGAYSPGATNTIDTVSIGGLSLNGGDLLYNLGNATSDRINLESYGVVELNGPVVFDFSNLGYSAGTFTLLTGNGVSSFNTANLSYNAVGNFSVSGNFVVSGNSLLFQTKAPDDYTWDGGAGNGSWNAAANWVGDQAPPDWKTVHFAGSIQPNVDTNTDQSVLGIVFDANAVSFTINSTSNNTINLAGNIENDSPNDQTINCNINLVTNSVIAADAARLALGGLITFGENSKFLAISGANSTDITGNISGNGSLLKRGAGTLTLSGANTFNGETLINAGNLILQGGAALKDSGIVKLAASGATLHIAGSETIGSLQGGGTTAIHAGQTLTIAETGNATYSGAITGAGALTKTGSGKWILSGANTYTGNTTINAGNLILEGGAALHDSGIVKLAASSATLTIGTSETIGSLQGWGTTAIHSGQNLTIAENSSATYAGAITGAGALTKTGSGALTLSGSNNHSGGTTLSGGTLQLLHANALGSGELHLSSGTLAVGDASNSVGLFVPGHITWASSNAIVSLASTGNITTAGNFTHGGNVGNRTFDFGSGQYLQLGNNTLVNFGATTFNAANFQATYSPGTSLSGNFQVVGNSLIYVLQGGSASGSVINNSGTGGTPTWVDFMVNGSDTTATGSNTIRSLAFANNRNLAIEAGHSLTLSQGQVAVENGSSIVSGGTLATPGNFNKTGAGELDVQSTLAVNGTASIDAGLLSVNGNLIADSVVVNPNATLGGAGLIVGNVNVNGNLSPGNSPGTLAIAGNLALTGANSTLIEIASPTNFDRIVVSGSANLGGALNVVESGGFELAYGQQYAFLTAAGGITGEFDTITAPATFRGRFLNLGTTGTILIAPDTYTRVAVTPNQRKVAKALDSFIPASSGDRETVSIALDLQTAEQYPYAFDQIMPGFYESLANIAIEQTYNQAQLLTQRLGTVRLGATGFQAIGMSQPIKYDKDGKSASDAKTASPIVEAPVDTNWNAWVIANGEFSLSRGLAGVPNYKNNAGGFLVGADYRLSENFAAGVFAGYEYSYAKYDGGSSTAGNSALFGLYGSYTHEDGYYADAIVSGGYTGFQTRRSIEFSTIDRTASADPNSAQFSAALNLGKDFEIGKFTLGPIVGAQYTYAGIGGFTETGAESLNLALGQQNANSLRTNLGARLAYNWEVGSNITLIPEIRGFWMHEFLNGPRNISSALAGGSGPSFDYETSAPYRNSIFGGVGISAKFADRWSASVFYNVNFGGEGYTNNIISTSLGFAF